MARDSRLSRLLLVVSLLLVLPHSSALARTPTPHLAEACLRSESRILVEDRSGLVSVDPVTGARTRIPVAEPRRVVALHATDLVLVEDARDRWVLVPIIGGATVRVPRLAAATLLLGQALTRPAPRWMVKRKPLADAVAYRVVDRSTDATVYSVSFERRIELAAASSSPDGRFFVHVQANNVASEVVIVDAVTRRQRTAILPHDARLAAFAISLTFSPDASCLAISMEREGDAAPQSWTLDLTGDAIAPRPVEWGSVLAWKATRR